MQEKARWVTSFTLVWIKISDAVFDDKSDESRASRSCGLKSLSFLSFALHNGHELHARVD